MTDQPTSPRPMTPNQMRAIVYKIARTYLEVERGLRSPDQLSAFLSRSEYRRQRITRRGPSADSRPVHPTDIGRVRLDAATPDRVGASVMVRRDDDRWSALLVDLKQTGQGWQVERLDRLERLLPPEPRHVKIDEEAHDRRRRFVERERQTVDAAYRAVQRRYDRIPDKRTTPARALRPEIERWSERLQALDDELRLVVGSRSVADDGVLRPMDVDGADAIARPDARHGLGVPALEPRDPEALATRYRERWGMAPGEPILGTTVGEIQAADRRALVDAIQDVFDGRQPPPDELRTPMVALEL